MCSPFLVHPRTSQSTVSTARETVKGATLGRSFAMAPNRCSSRPVWFHTSLNLGSSSTVDTTK